MSVPLCPQVDWGCNSRPHLPRRPTGADETTRRLVCARRWST